MTGATTVSESEAVTQAAAIPLETFQGDSVQVGDMVVHIGKLSIDQWLALARFATKAFAALPSVDAQQVRQRAQDVADGAALDAQEGLDWIMPMLNKDLLLELYSIATGLDAAYLESNFDILQFMAVASAVATQNDPAGIIAAFKDAAQRWRPRSVGQ